MRVGLEDLSRLPQNNSLAINYVNMNRLGGSLLGRPLIMCLTFTFAPFVLRDNHYPQSGPSIYVCAHHLVIVLIVYFVHSIKIKIECSPHIVCLDWGQIMCLFLFFYIFFWTKNQSSKQQSRGANTSVNLE